MERQQHYGALPAQTIAALEAIRAEAMACTACPLHKSRDQVAIYRGHGIPRVLFLGEAPGATENQMGLPFVGPAGRILDDKLVEIGLGDFGIVNVVNCQPIGNELLPGSVDACDPFLRRKLNLLAPYVQILALLGRKPERIITDRLVSHSATTMNLRPRYILPILHPAALLHYRGPQFAERWESHWKDLRAKAVSLGILPQAAAGFKLLPVSGGTEK